MVTFDRAEKAEFKRNGFLVLPDAVDEDLLAEARRVREEDPGAPNDAAELRELAEAENPRVDLEGRGAKLYPDQPGYIIDAPQPEHFRSINEQVYEYAEALVGEGRLDPPGEHSRVTVRLPQETDMLDPGAQQPSGLGTHLDGIGDGGRLVTVGAAIYPDRVQPRGGGFTVWPGSHRLAGEYLATLDAENYAQAGGGLPARTGDGWDDSGRLREQFDPIEVSGGVGTVTMWHGHMEHSGGVNLSPGHMRYALFSRFHLADYDVAEIGPDPWHGWSAMEGIEVGDVGP